MMSSEIALDQKEYMRQDFVGQAVNGNVAVQKARVLCALCVNLWARLFESCRRGSFPACKR